MFLFHSIFLACDEGKPADTSAQENHLTFHGDIAPILSTHCVACHQDSGQGVGDFTSFSEVEALAPLIVESIESNRMPPPVADPECRDYKGSDVLHLSDENKSLIRTWYEQGAHEGDPSLAQVFDDSSFTLENPDLIVQIEEPYTPQFTSESNPGNEYRCFSVEHGRTEPFYITAVHPIVDNAELVHHIVIAKGDEQGIIQDSNRPEGKGCIRRGGAFIRDFEHGAMLSGWAPGMRPVELEDDVGMLVLPDDYIIIQVHYFQNPDAARESDQTGVAFRTTDSVSHVVQMLPLGLRDFTIPANTEAHTETDTLTLPIGYRIWGVFPHMHVLGSAYSFSVGTQEKEECLVRSDHYDFENQLSYLFHKEVEVEANTPFNLSCTWNNAANNPNLVHNPPVDIQDGERTDEEMCYAFSLVSFN